MGTAKSKASAVKKAMTADHAWDHKHGIACGSWEDKAIDAAVVKRAKAGKPTH